MHKNTAKVNDLWHALDYFTPKNFARRLANAMVMLKGKSTSEDIFHVNFNSAEGWYSQIVLQSNVGVKIIGRGMDDFSRDPVILDGGRLARCPPNDLVRCLTSLDTLFSNTTVFTLPPVKAKAAHAHHHKSVCRMQWLPSELRYCLASAVYDKKSALAQDPSDGLRLDRIGEAFMHQGDWFVNDEMTARRQVPEGAAFFHFRHWDDFASTSISTTWGTVPGRPTDTTGDASELGCMVRMKTSYS
jgi:hypothetical protein